MKASSKFQWREVTKEDYYEVLVKWWEDWGWTPPPIHSLPKGFIVSKDGVDLYAGFIYFTGTTIAWFEWIVSNKNAPIELRKGALDRLVDIISIIAKEKGVLSLFSTTNSSSFKNSLIKSGFGVTDEGVFNLTRST